MTGCKLRQVTVSDSKPEVVTAHYRVIHSTPGRDGTTLETHVQVKAGCGQTEAKLLDSVLLKERNVTLALDKLADWLIRTGETLKTRDKNADALVMSVLDD